MINQVLTSQLPPWPGGAITAAEWGVDNLNDGMSYRVNVTDLAVSGMVSTIWADVVTTGITVNVPGLVGKAVRLILRGGIGTGKILTSGTPVNAQVLFDTITGDLTVDASNTWVQSEELTIQFI